MCRLIFICLLLSGCVTSSGSVQYSVSTEFDEQGKTTKITESWEGKSSTRASGDSGIKASQKNIDFGITMPNNVSVHLKAGSNIEGMKSKNATIMSMLEGMSNEEKASAFRSLATIFAVP